MAVIFAKLAPSLHRNPKVRKAGRDGRDLWVFCICVNAELGATGIIPADYFDLAYLADTLQCDEGTAASAVQRCMAAKLLEHWTDGSMRMVGWDEEEWGRARVGSMTEAERKAQQRANRKAGKPRVAVQTDDTRPDTSGHATGRPDMSRDQSRSEKSRSDLSLPATGATVGVFAPGEAGKLAELAIDLLNAARREIDPAAPPLAALVSTPDLAGIKRSLEPVPAADRESTLRHAVAVLAAWVKAEKGQPIGELRIGQLCGERSWARWVAGTVASEKKRGGGRGGGGTAPATAAPAAHHGTGSTDPRSL